MPENIGKPVRFGNKEEWATWRDKNFGTREEWHAYLQNIKDKIPNLTEKKGHEMNKLAYGVWDPEATAERYLDMGVDYDVAKDKQKLIKLTQLFNDLAVKRKMKLMFTPYRYSENPATGQKEEYDVTEAVKRIQKANDLPFSEDQSLPYYYQLYHPKGYGKDQHPLEEAHALLGKTAGDMKMNKLAFVKGYFEGLEKVAISTLDKTSASMPPFRIIDPAKFVAKQVRTGMTYTPPGPGKPAASFKTKNLVQKLMDILSKTSVEKVAFGPEVGGGKNTLTESIADAVYPEQDPVAIKRKRLQYILQALKPQVAHYKTAVVSPNPNKIPSWMFEGIADAVYPEQDPVAIKRKRLQTMLQALKPQVAHYKVAMVPIASIGNDQGDFQNNRLAKALSGQFEIPTGNGRKMTIHTNPATWAAAKAKTGQMYRKEGYTFKERMNHAFTGRKKQAPVTSQGAEKTAMVSPNPNKIPSWMGRPAYAHKGRKSVEMAHYLNLIQEHMKNNGLKEYSPPGGIGQLNFRDEESKQRFLQQLRGKPVVSSAS